MNAEQFALPQNRYDAVISRLGLMLIKRMQQALTSAGFQEVQVQAIALTFQFPFFETLTAWWGPPFEKALVKLEPEPGQCMLEEVRQAVRHLRDRRGSWHQQNC